MEGILVIRLDKMYTKLPEDFKVLLNLLKANGVRYFSERNHSLEKKFQGKRRD